jgi:hypothetical protein
MLENLNIDQSRLYVILKRVLQRHESEIEALNKSQLSKGELSDGSKLPPYSKGYLKTRRKHRRPITPMDLNLTGDLYQSWFTTFFDSYLSLDSLDGKGPIHEKRFGSGIYGLSPESIEILIWEKGVADEFVVEFIKEIFG